MRHAARGGVLVVCIATRMRHEDVCVRVAQYGDDGGHATRHVHVAMHDATFSSLCHGRCGVCSPRRRPTDVGASEIPHWRRRWGHPFANELPDKVEWRLIFSTRYNNRTPPAYEQHGYVHYTCTEGC
jgi:hypothetical protein